MSLESVGVPPFPAEYRASGCRLPGPLVSAGILTSFEYRDDT